MPWAMESSDWVQGFGFFSRTMEILAELPQNLITQLSLNEWYLYIYSYVFNLCIDLFSYYIFILYDIIYIYNSI